MKDNEQQARDLRHNDELRELGRPVVAAWLHHREVRILQTGDAVDLMVRVGAAIEAERVHLLQQTATKGTAEIQRLEEENAELHIRVKELLDEADVRRGYV